MDSGKKIRMENHLGEHRAEFVITRIYWERVYLVLEAGISPAADDLEFYLLTERASVKARMEAEKLQGGKLRLKVNVTNPGYCSCLPSDVYSLYACAGKEVLAKAAVSAAVSPAARLSSCGSRKIPITAIVRENTT